MSRGEREMSDEDYDYYAAKQEDRDIHFFHDRQQRDADHLDRHPRR